MSQQDLLRRVVEALERAGVDYMLTGSFVSSLQGEPRATHDIDDVVAMNETAVRTLVDAFPPPEFYLTEDPFDQSRFSGNLSRKFWESPFACRVRRTRFWRNSNGQRSRAEAEPL